MCARSLCLKDDIDESREDLEAIEKPINVGIISSQLCQYCKKATDFQCPWTMTINGLMPRKRR